MHFRGIMSLPRYEGAMIHDLHEHEKTSKRQDVSPGVKTTR